MGQIMKVIFSFLSAMLVSYQVSATTINIGQDDLTEDQMRTYAHLPLCLRAKALEFNNAWQEMHNHIDDNPLRGIVEEPPEVFVLS